MSLANRLPVVVHDGGVAYLVVLDDDLFRMQFHCTAQLLLLAEEFHEMVWNQALSLAHRCGLIPVGPVMVSEEPCPPVESLTEGEPMVPRQRQTEDVVLVTAEVLVGAVL